MKEVSRCRSRCDAQGCEVRQGMCLRQHQLRQPAPVFCISCAGEPSSNTDKEYVIALALALSFQLALLRDA